MTSPGRDALAPLIETLRQRLAEAGLESPGPAPADADSFVIWYLDVVQSLEAHLAATDRRAAMSRREVELMCRCAASGSTLREAAELVADFCAMLHPRAGRTSLTVAAGRASFQLDSLRGQSSAVSAVVDITGLHAFYQLFCWLVGQQLPLDSVTVPRGSREVLQSFLVLFDAPALAEGALYELRFDAGLLASPLVRTRGEIQAFLDDYPCRLFGAAAGAGTRQQVLALLGAAAQQGAPLPTLQQIAAVVGVSEITLRRRLATEGARYRELKDESLVQAARFHLERGEASIEEIAGRLGFSDATAFRRSFKRCTGRSPSAFRRS